MRCSVYNRLARMRSTRPSPVLIILLAASLLAPGPAGAQELDQLVARNLAAKGGVEALKGTTTVQMRGSVRLHQPAPGVEPIVIQMTVSARRPNLVRRDMSFQGETRSVVFDGQTAWQITPQGASELRGPQADAVRAEGEFDSILLTWREQGHRLELAGDDTVDGRKVHRIRVIRKDGPVQIYHLDAETALERKVVTETRDGTQTMTSEMFLSDYRTVGGRTVPFKARQVVNGQLVAEIDFAAVEYNLPLDEGLFRPKAGGR